MLLPLAPPPLEPPQIVAPAPFEVSFGRVAGRVSAGTVRVRITVGSRVLAERDLVRRRFVLNVELPRRDVAVRVTAFDATGRSATRTVTPVFGLPRRAAALGGRPPRGREDPVLARTITRLARAFRGTCSIFVQDFRTGRGAAWNARAAFPAASTLKVAIAVERLRMLGPVPRPGSRDDVLLRRMLIPSNSEAANHVLTRIGGSTSGGSARVNATLRALGLFDTEMYGGYIPGTALADRPIPIRNDQRPSFTGKRTTAWDLSRLDRYLHLAATGRGLLVRRFRGQFTPSDARYLLYLLAHVREPGRLSRYTAGQAAVVHKAGWITTARHDSGLVYWRDGAFVATVMTWSPNGVGTASDVLAGRVARAALNRFGG